MARERTETIGVRVTPDEKERFENYLQSEEGRSYTSLADLLRKSAHTTISEQDDQSTTDPEEIRTAVTDGLQDVHHELERLRDEITVIKTEVSDDSTIRDLAAEIYEYLPRFGEKDPFETSATAYWDPDEEQTEEDLGIVDESDYHLNVDSVEALRKFPTVTAFAHYLDEPVQDVHRALSWGTEYYPDMKEQAPPLETDKVYSRYYRLQN